jgi:tRNA dimethylallyltransferase
VPEVIAVFGPTASGKTAVAEVLADRLGTGLVSADAMQVYRGLPILTNQSAKPARLVAIWPLSHEASVGEFEQLAHDAIDELVASHGVAVVAGGTGLYLRAALTDLELPPAPAAGARERWEAAYEADRRATYAELENRDPPAAAAVHPNDRRRVVRALELTEAGRSLAPAASRLWSDDFRRPTLVVGLDVPTDVLAQRIEERTHEMFQRGVVEEVQAELAAGPVSTTAEKAMGLREIASLSTDAEPVLVARTRRYAAYQRKWMRRIPGIVMIDADRPPAEVADAILEVAWTSAHLKASSDGG